MDENKEKDIDLFDEESEDDDDRVADSETVSDQEFIDDDNNEINDIPHSAVKFSDDEDDDLFPKLCDGKVVVGLSVKELFEGTSVETTFMDDCGKVRTFFVKVPPKTAPLTIVSHVQKIPVIVDVILDSYSNWTVNEDNLLQTKIDVDAILCVLGKGAVQITDLIGNVHKKNLQVPVKCGGKIYFEDAGFSNGPLVAVVNYKYARIEKEKRKLMYKLFIS